MITRYSGGALGARNAAHTGSRVVVVDTFRASTTVSVLVDKEAKVLPVASIEEARAARADFRIGERGSVKVEGFDFGNSPKEIEAAEIPSGSTVVLSTTNGTRVLEAAAGAPAILTGAFVNAEAIAEDLIATDRDLEVAVVGCGWEGHRASEDEAAAGAILCRLQKRGAKLDERAQRVVDLYIIRPARALHNNSAARRLKRVGYEADLDFCLAEDTLDVVPRLLEGIFVNGRK